MKKLLSLFVAMVFLVSPLSLSAHASVKAGLKCATKGQTLSSQGKKFTCIKSGKKLIWNKGVASVKPSIIPSPALRAEDLKPGLLRADFDGYHEDQMNWFTFRTPAKKSIVSTVDVQTHDGDNFSIKWTGYFIPDETGKWQITSTSDDGSGVWIGKSAINAIPDKVASLSAPGIHGPTTISKQIFMEQGRLYPLRILFGDKTNWAQMTLSVQSPTSNTSKVSLQGLVWHSPISSEKDSGIDPQYASSQLSKESEVTPSSIPVVSEESSLDSIELCKLKNVNTFSGNGRGFPSPIGRLATSGDIKGIVLFVEFSDVKGDNDTQRRFDDYTKKFIEFYSKQSYGKLSINMDYHPEYFLINKSSSIYGMQTHNAGNPWLYIRDALAAADPEVNFSPYDFVVVIPPAKIKNIVYGPAFPLASWDNQLATNEKVIRNATVAGTDSILRPERSWFWLSHEVGHLFGLEHQYTWENVTYTSQLRGIWDLMDTGDSAPEFLAWHRFVLGWLDSKNVRCIDRDRRIGTDSIHFISPLVEQNSLPKSVMVRLNNHEAIVIELRRNLGFDKIAESDEGVVAYKVNVRDVGKSQEVMILTNQPYQKGETIAGNLTPGEKIIDSSVEITVLKSTNAGDYIKVAMLKP